MAPSCEGVESCGVQRCSGELSARALFGADHSPRISYAHSADQATKQNQSTCDTDANAGRAVSRASLEPKSSRLAFS
jgi:hypothetical protein